MKSRLLIIKTNDVEIRDALALIVELFSQLPFLEAIFLRLKKRYKRIAGNSS
jgi:hypothetical protein